jgi:hypothetical protein
MHRCGRHTGIPSEIDMKVWLPGCDEAAGGGIFRAMKPRHGRQAMA